MKLKSDVNITGIRSELILALFIAEKVYEEKGYNLVITSVLDGRHSKTSLHYAGAAADLRTRDVSNKDQNWIVKTLKKMLTVDFDVIRETTHIHLEWQPRQANG